MWGCRAAFRIGLRGSLTILQLLALSFFCHGSGRADTLCLPLSLFLLSSPLSYGGHPPPPDGGGRQSSRIVIPVKDRHSRACGNPRTSTRQRKAPELSGPYRVCPCMFSLKGRACAALGVATLLAARQAEGRRSAGRPFSNPFPSTDTGISPFAPSEIPVAPRVLFLYYWKYRTL